MLNTRRLKFYQFTAFLFRRRSQVWISFYNTIEDRFWLSVWKIFFPKNIFFYEQWNKAGTKKRIDLFAFRNEENLEKFEKAQKIREKDGFTDEASRLYGEAMGYPDFAVNDFMELGKVEKGDRIGFRCFEYGYDGFVCRPENFEKLKEWIKSQKIPFEKVVISDNETGKWRYWALTEFENRKNK